LETPAVIDAINTGGKHRSACPRQPSGILEFAVTDDSEQESSGKPSDDNKVYFYTILNK